MKTSQTCFNCNRQGLSCQTSNDSSFSLCSLFSTATTTNANNEYTPQCLFNILALRNPCVFDIIHSSFGRNDVFIIIDSVLDNPRHKAAGKKTSPSGTRDGSKLMPIAATTQIHAAQTLNVGVIMSLVYQNVSFEGLRNLIQSNTKHLHIGVQELNVNPAQPESSGNEEFNQPGNNYQQTRADVPTLKEQVGVVGTCRLCSVEGAEVAAAQHFLTHNLYNYGAQLHVGIHRRVSTVSFFFVNSHIDLKQHPTITHQGLSYLQLIAAATYCKATSLEIG